MALPVIPQPIPDPYATYQLPVTDGHSLYVEEYGRPDGLPVLFLHGGPGGGIEPKHRLLFEASVFRAILFDQRGAGKSQPHASLEANTTWHIVADIERIRSYLGIEKWLVLGGSWGSTLALAYAQEHPKAVLGLVLRGVFLGLPTELHWLYQEGVSHLSPQHWKPYYEYIPEAERDNMIAAYHRRLTAGSTQEQLQAALRWASWELTNCKLEVPGLTPYTLTEADAHLALSLARIESHYFMNNLFFDEKTAILNRLDRLKSIPMEIVHGRYDLVCPLSSAWRLAEGVLHANLRIVPMAGHASSEPGLFEAQQMALMKLAMLCLNNELKSLV